MPKFDKLILEQTAQIITPISEIIVEKFLKYIGVYEYFPESIHITSSEQQAYVGCDEEGRPKINEDRCDVIITPNMNPKAAEWEVFNSKAFNQYGIPDSFFNSEYPIFSDPANRITLHQYTVPCSVRLEFSLKFKNIEKADMTNSALFNKIMTDSIFQYTDVVYTYPIPDIIFMALYKFYKMQNIDPAITFKNYLDIGSNIRFGTIANRDDQSIKQNVVLQNNASVLCNARYTSELPEGEKKGKVTSRYILDFEMIYQFSKPNMLTLSYPYMINNTPIPKVLIPRANVMRTEPLSMVHPNIAMNSLLNGYQQNCDPDFKYPLTQYPSIGLNIIKTNTIPGVEKNYRPIFTSILSIDASVEPKKILINLEEDVFPLMPGYMVERIRKVFTTHKENDIKLFLGLFNFSIIKNDLYTVSHDRLSIDMINKTITVNTNLNLRSEYRLVINQVKTAVTLSTAYIMEMLADPEYWDIIIYKNLNYLVKNGFIIATKDPLSFSLNQHPTSTANTVSNVHFYRNSFRIFDYIIKPIKERRG